VDQKTNANTTKVAKVVALGAMTFNDAIAMVSNDIVAYELAA